MKLSDVLSRGDLPILCVYDFGDDWHMVMYEGGAQLDGSVKYPRCVSGARKYPPEDCGVDDPEKQGTTSKRRPSSVYGQQRLRPALPSR